MRIIGSFVRAFLNFSPPEKSRGNSTKVRIGVSAKKKKRSSEGMTGCLFVGNIIYQPEN